MVRTRAFHFHLLGGSTKLCCMKGRHGRQCEILTLNQKSDSGSRCAFTRRKIPRQISCRYALKRRRLRLFREITSRGRHLETMTSYPKSDSVSRCVFTRGTILWNFYPIQLETTEPYRFYEEVAQQEQQQQQQDE